MSYGDGAIYMRSDGRWAAKYVAYSGAKPKYLYGKSESEVKRKLKQFKQSPEVLSAVAPSKLTLEEYLWEWLRVFKKPTIKQSTYDRLESVIRGTITPEMGWVPVGDLTAKMCQEFINKMLDEGKSYWVIKKAYDTLSNCMEHAVKSGDLSRNPMATVGAPSKANFEQKDTRALSREEEQALLTELERTYASSGRPVYNYRFAFILLLNTGMRLGELLALDWDDVDLGAKTLSISKNAVMVRTRDSKGKAIGKQEQIIQPTPKTKSGNRIIPLNQTAINALRHLKNEAGTSNYVVNTSNFNRPLANALLKQINLAYSRCNITNAGVHTLRHTCATRLFERGAQLKDVSAILGHSSIGVTANTYVHVLADRKQNVVNLLDEP